MRLGKLYIHWSSGNPQLGRCHWVRYGARVLWLTNSPELFSERNGMHRAIYLPMGWRIRWQKD